MHIYYTILKVLYYVITSCIVGLIGWRLVASTKLSNKIIAMLAILMFTLRLIMVR
jgi:hypothetical protein